MIPIYSISNFQNTIKQEEKDILLHFNKLNPEEQPIFLFIDYEKMIFTNINI